MAHGYGITGWSGGTRVPLTYNLKAGQFRGLGGLNVFPSRTIVNNYGCCHNSGCYDDGMDAGMPKWMQWLMGFGFGSQLLGGIFSMFCGGGGPRASKSAASDNKGVLNEADTQTLTALKAEYKDNVEITGPRGDGSYAVLDKTTKAKYHFNSLDAVQKYLDNNPDYNGGVSGSDSPTNSRQNAQIKDTELISYLSRINSDENVKKYNISGKMTTDGKYELTYTKNGLSVTSEPIDGFDNFKNAVDRVIATGSHEESVNNVAVEDDDVTSKIDTPPNTLNTFNQKWADKATLENNNNGTYTLKYKDANGQDITTVISSANNEAEACKQAETILTQTKITPQITVPNTNNSDANKPKTADISDFIAKYPDDALKDFDISVVDGTITIKGKQGTPQEKVNIIAKSWDEAAELLKKSTPTIVQNKASDNSAQPNDNTNNITYAVNKGDTWYSIASKNYGGFDKLSAAEKQTVWRAIKDATNKDKYGSGAKYNSSEMPNSVNLPKEISISGSKKVILNSGAN